MRPSNQTDVVTLSCFIQ